MEEEEHSSGSGFWFPADFLSETELLPKHWILSNSKWREKTSYIGPWQLLNPNQGVRQGREKHHSKLIVYSHCQDLKEDHCSTRDSCHWLQDSQNYYVQAMKEGPKTPLGLQPCWVTIASTVLLATFLFRIVGLFLHSILWTSSQDLSIYPCLVNLSQPLFWAIAWAVQSTCMVQ